MQRTVGAWGAAAVSFAVMVAALSSANATMITGARSNYALGRDVPPPRVPRRLEPGASHPRAAFLLQGLIALLLVGFGALARSGFEAMVAYTAPVFWLILFGTGAAVMVLRRRDPDTERPFRVPLYPVVPLLFCGVAAYMLYSSVAYAGRGALLGVAVMLAGIPVWPLPAAAARRPSTLQSHEAPHGHPSPHLLSTRATRLGDHGSARFPPELAGQETTAPARQPDVHSFPPTPRRCARCSRPRT